MAPKAPTQAERAASELRQAEREERELNEDINQAIAATDAEVFADAMGDDPIGETTDTSLEEMGDGLEGEPLEEEDIEGDEDEQPIGDEQGDDEPPLRTEQRQDQQQRGDQQQERGEPRIPPRVLRETRERFREAESRLEQQVSDLLEQNRQLMQMVREGRMPQQTQEPPARQQQQTQQPPARQQAQEEQVPDMWAQPEEYAAYLDRRAERRVEERLAAFQQRQQQQREQQLDAALQSTARGPRAYEFNVAYNDLTSLPKTRESADLINRLITSPDPGAAILEWWEESSNPEYVQWHRERVAQHYLDGGQPQRQQRRAPDYSGDRSGQMRRGAPGNVRHETRLPPSLNSASGGRSQHTVDPAAFDGSERSIFDSALAS